MKVLTWNIKGLNSPQKRKKVFLFLERHKADIICLQESRIKQKDVRLVKNPKIGKEFISAYEKSKRGVILYIKDSIESKLVFADPNGYYVGVESIWQGKKILILGIYSPQERKGSFYAKLHRKLLNYEYENIIMIGDFNGVINPIVDRKSGKKVKDNQGKLPQKFFDLIDDFSLIDSWRHLYNEEKSFTFYSSRHESLARIDLCLISNTLIREATSIEVLNRTISDHNPLMISFKESTKGSKNWFLNEELLKDETIVEKGKEWIKFFFEKNLNGEVKPSMVWDAFKASMRGFFTQQNIIWWKQKTSLRNKLNNTLKEKEELLRKCPKNKAIQKEIKSLQKQMDIEMISELEK